MSKHWRIPKLTLAGAIIGAVVSGVATAFSVHSSEPGYYVGAMAGFAFCGGLLFTLVMLTCDVVHDCRRMRQRPAERRFRKGFGD